MAGELGQRLRPRQGGRAAIGDARVHRARPLKLRWDHGFTCAGGLINSHSFPRDKLINLITYGFL